LQSSDTLRVDRKQLVGLLTEAPEVVLPEGVHLIATSTIDPPQATLGHVTSSYYSANCGRSIALALVHAGLSRIGDSIYAVVADRAVKVRVTAPQFLDAAPAVSDG
jgi:sarcosine oxidase subunit alpha